MFSRTVSVAPMMGWTDRHARYFLRLISKRVLLYTEMVTTGAILHGHRESLLKYHPHEHPLALQLGGSNADDLAECSKIAEDIGFDEVNLNVGCPSDRVKSGHFGACLMAQPDLVAECVHAMQSKIDIPVTVKCRIGIDEMEDYSDLSNFVRIISEAGCNVFIVHARKAWLKGLSPKQNREVPPLNYDFVYRLKQEFSNLSITLNGGVKTLDAVDEHLQCVDGVMLGREAYHNPYVLANVDQQFYGSTELMLSRREILDAFVPYIESELAAGTLLHSITRHIHGLFLACPGAKAWRRYLSENDNRADAGVEVVTDAASLVSGGRSG
jgi:tRNA-dihydrouridine synthase A